MLANLDSELRYDLEDAYGFYGHGTLDGDD